MPNNEECGIMDDGLFVTKRADFLKYYHWNLNPNYYDDYDDYGQLDGACSFWQPFNMIGYK